MATQKQCYSRKGFMIGAGGTFAFLLVGSLLTTKSKSEALGGALFLGVPAAIFVGLVGLGVGSAIGSSDKKGTCK